MSRTTETRVPVRDVFEEGDVVKLINILRDVEGRAAA